MTYKERMKAYCKSCEHHSTCGWVRIGTIERCFDVQEFMSGWEAGQTDTIEEIEKLLPSDDSKIYNDAGRALIWRLRKRIEELKGV